MEPTWNIVHGGTWNIHGTIIKGTWNIHGTCQKLQIRKDQYLHGHTWTYMEPHLKIYLWGSLPPNFDAFRRSMYVPCMYYYCAEIDSTGCWTGWLGWLDWLLGLNFEIILYNLIRW